MLTLRHQQILETQRALDPELLVRYGVDSSRRGGDWIEIPYLRNGVRVNTKWRTIAGEKKFYQEPGAEKCLWNVDVLADEALRGHVPVITEGEMDAFAAIQAGALRTMSVPDGAPKDAKGEDYQGRKYAFLDGALPLLKREKAVILATDNDGPGIALLHDLALRIGKARCKYVRYPSDCKDLGDVLRKLGPGAVRAVLDGARWLKVDGLYRLSELPPVVEEVALPIGMAGLADHYKVRRGDFTVVTGIPGHGKSAFVNEVAGRMAEEHGWSVVVFGFEQSPIPDHRRLLRSFRTRRREIDLLRWYPEDLAKADAWIDEHFVFVMPDEDDTVSLSWVLDRAEAAILQHDASFVIIDPWNEMDHDRPPDMTQTEYTGFAIKQFRKLAKKYHVHVIVVAHPYKLRPAKAGDAVPMPTLYDISDSAHWYNKCDVGIIVHRCSDAETEICIQKVRYHDAIGKPGRLVGFYLRDQARFEIKIDANGSTATPDDTKMKKQRSLPIP